MSSTIQEELISLKKENVKLKENFDTFRKKHEANKKFISKNNVRNFMGEQKTLMDAINQQIDKIISKDQLQTTPVPQKRTRSENLSLGVTSRASKKYHKEVIAKHEDENQHTVG